MPFAVACGIGAIWRLTTLRNPLAYHVSLSGPWWFTGFDRGHLGTVASINPYAVPITMLRLDIIPSAVALFDKKTSYVLVDEKARASRYALAPFGPGSAAVPGCQQRHSGGILVRTLVILRIFLDMNVSDDIKARLAPWHSTP